MRRQTFFRLCCLAVLLAALSGCAPVAIPAPENGGSRAALAVPAELPTDGYPLVVGGVTLRPPLSLTDLERLGFSVAEPDAPLLASLAVSEPLAVTGRGTEFAGRLYNPTEEPLPWRECLLVSVRGGRGMTADGGVTAGSSRNDVLAAYGAADEGSVEENANWIMYGTWLYYGLGFEIDNRSQRVVSMVSFCAPLDAGKAGRP